MYSSIKEEDWPKVIKICYWPILDIIKSLEIPLGIEISGHSLEMIKKIDSRWISSFKKLLKAGKTELIGSGYMQIIGPLIPREINAYNHKFGLDSYRKILDCVPEIALVNEQAYSCGLIDGYKKAGYKAVIMEWDNPFRFHPEWDSRWRYYPQMASDDCGNCIPVIWNNAILFQKFQRYAHGEIELEEYMSYLKSHFLGEETVLSLYGNDAETFDFRPGRFHTESDIHKGGEWNRIKVLLKGLKKDSKFSFILPSGALKFTRQPLANNRIHLESCAQPIPVKKQEKYNIARWAVTGRNDTIINTKCYRLYDYLKDCNKSGKNKAETEGLWRKLCYLWSSDFRTHIEKARWRVFNKDLNYTLKKAKKIYESTITKNEKFKPNNQIIPSSIPEVRRIKTKIEIENKKNELILNCNKGLTITSLIFKDISPCPLIGTISHGYYDDISLGADYFTGHTIIEGADLKKFTDLASVVPDILDGFSSQKPYIQVRGTIKLGCGTIKKEINFYLLESKIDIRYIFNLNFGVPVSLRTGIVTLLPEAFDKNTLYYKTVNGGTHKETFRIGGTASINFGAPVSRMVTASHCLGATDGWLEMGDKDKNIRIYSDKAKMYSVPMLEYKTVSNSYFLRCLNSLREIDETSIEGKGFKGEIKFSIIASKNKQKEKRCST